MVRQTVKDQKLGLKDGFGYRGLEQTRIETFSDAVFALAVTLLILSSSVPQNFSELLASFSQIFPFAICITLLMLI